MGESAARTPRLGFATALTNLLWKLHSFFTAGDFCWNRNAFRARRALKRPAPHRGKRKEASRMMHAIDLTGLLLVPAGLAVTFLLWVLWNFHKAARRP